MAIRVEHSSYTYGASMETERRLIALCGVAVIAELLGETNLSDDAKNTYFSISNKIDQTNREQTKGKSWKSWLTGASESHIVKSSNQWNTHYPMLKEACSKMSNTELRKQLNGCIELVKNPWSREW